MLEKLGKEELIERLKELEKENKELKEKLYGKLDRKVEEKEISKETKAISTEEKIKIFMEIFKGRTDNDETKSKWKSHDKKA